MHKPRLSRLEWLYTDRPLFFITTSTHQKRRFLAHEIVHEAFVDFCKRGEERGVYVGRYVLMPDHLHLFAAFASNRASISKWVQILKLTLAKVVKAQGHAGPYWQKGFFDHVLRSQESYAEKWTYVRRNPVRAGLAKNEEDWPFQGQIFPLEF